MMDEGWESEYFRENYDVLESWCGWNKRIFSDTSEGEGAWTYCDVLA